MIRRFEKLWSENAFTRNKKRKGETYARPLVSFLQVSIIDPRETKKSALLLLNMPHTSVVSSAMNNKNVSAFPHNRGLAPAARVRFLRWVQQRRVGPLLHPSETPIVWRSCANGAVSRAKQVRSRHILNLVDASA